MVGCTALWLFGYLLIKIGLMTAMVAFFVGFTAIGIGGVIVLIIGFIMMALDGWYYENYARFNR